MFVCLTAIRPTFFFRCFIVSALIVLPAASCSSNKKKEGTIDNNVSDISANKKVIKIGEDVTISVFFSTKRFVEGDRSNVDLVVKLPQSLGFKLGSDRVYGNGSQDVEPAKIDVCTEEKDGTFLTYGFTDGELDTVGDKRDLIELRFVARGLKRDPQAVIESTAGSSVQARCGANKRYQEFEQIQVGN